MVPRVKRNSNQHRKPSKMSTHYIVQNHHAPAGKPSFTATRNRARSSETITFSYYKGNPSNAGDVHPQIRRLCYHDGASVVTASGQVDDDVAIIAPGINRRGGQQGSQRAFSETGASVPAGYYDVCVTHSNIQNHPAGNISVLTGSLGPCPEAILIPEKNDEVSCDDCSCGGSAGTEGGVEDTPAARSIANVLPASFASSSGGSGVVRTANARHMRFAFHFGSFRGMGQIPGGQPEIVAFGFDASLLTPAALSYKHPLAAALVPQSDTIAPNEMFCVYDGASYTNYVVLGDGSRAFGVGASSKASAQVHFVSELSCGSEVVCALEDEAAAYLRVASADGSALFFDLATNAFIAYMTSDDATIFAYEKLVTLRTADGAIRQIWNYWDGLADVLPAADGAGYSISFYLPSQVIIPAEAGELFRFTGEPFKTFTISGDVAAQSLTVRERDHSLPDTMPDYTSTWTHTDAGWNLTTGEDAEAVAETRVRTELEDGTYRVVTTQSQGNTVASCVAEVFSSTLQGELCLSRTEGYGTDAAQTTRYEYDETGRQVLRIAPDGGEYKTVYDAYGRVTVTRTPWAGGQCRLSSTTYRDADSYNSDPATVVESCVTSSGQVVTLRTDAYTYTEAGHVRRVEKRSTAAASSATQLMVTETWLATAPNSYACGRTKMTQAVNGVQTHYAYEASTSFGALYTVTQETRVEGSLVAGQSRRRVDYISASGNTLRTEEYALLADGETWALLSGVTNSYDTQNRLVGTAKDNGRSSSRTLTCTGELLSETDEDGVTTTYGYDSARRLVEVIRAEVREGDTVITPETITTYTHDALGRTLSVRRDVGAMTTIESTEYDLLGRVTRQTDALGRETLTSYSADGLTTTVTQPNGATLISTRNTDGSVAHVSGTGQRELWYVYDINGSRLRETVKLADQSTTVSQSLQDGFGQTIVTSQAVVGGFVYERSTYNAKAQLTRRQRDTGSGSGAQSMAATTYAYDAFGNQTQQTLLLDESAAEDVTKNRIVEQASTVEAAEDGVYAVMTLTRYTADGRALTSTRRQLLSVLSAVVENKQISINERGLTSAQWTEYNAGTKRVQKQTVPTSAITAETVMVDGFALSQSDHAGISSSQTRVYTSTGVTLTRTDGRGNTTTTVTDTLGRTMAVTDAAGNLTGTAYEATSDQPSCITNAQGKETHYRYDLRGRKVAEWGTAVQPALFAYDDADRLVGLTTFRACEGDVTTDPAERTDGDTTLWVYDAASGLELSKTYADGSTVTKSYDAFGRQATETNARGMVKTLAYDAPTGQLTGVSFVDDAAPAQSLVYNVQGQVTQVTDAAGTRTFTYNEYGELVTDSLAVDDETHLITENRDEFGRSTGFAYSEADGAFGSEQYSYGTDGRLATAAFSHNGESKQFGFSYLHGSNLMQTLTMPNGMTLTQQFETQRDLLTGMLYKREETSVVERYYTYDTLGRPLTRQQNRQGGSCNDSFTHNDRNELTAGILGSKGYYYTYDNIGNRKTAKEDADEATNYDANALNQYTAVGSFEPEFDADGNQTKVQTSTGIWNVTYNAENRPIVFERTNSDGTTTRVTCAYDYMGRRTTKKVETIAVDTTATTLLHQRYIYRGYLQIAGFDLTESGHAFRWFITWDPTQEEATRPLAIRKDGTWYCYGWDLTKNVCEVFSKEGYISNTVIYSYTPYGHVTAEGSVIQPIQWSSEFYDDELGLVYYNYRHYNPIDGRWISRDTLEAEYGLYLFIGNDVVQLFDRLGLVKKWTTVSLEQAKQHYQNGNGESVEVSINLIETPDVGKHFNVIGKWLSSKKPWYSKLPFVSSCEKDQIEYSKLKQTYSTKFPEWFVFGTITLYFSGTVKIDCNCEYSIKGTLTSAPDRYNFEMHDAQDNLKERVRNGLTMAGQKFNGPGRDYDIKITGGKSVNETGKW